MWEPRTVEKHRSDCLKVLSCATKNGIQQTESELGVRPCALLNLPYYDPIKFVSIDIMHNLFLGTAKHIFTIWIETGLLTKDKLSLTNDTISHFVVPNNIGRVPSNIASNYFSFKAAQWSTWTTIYSPVALKNILPDEHYKCWLLFVRAVSIISQRIITESDIQSADSLLVMFCKKVTDLYGTHYCTPNMHMHLHVKETLLDFGPVHATWCFSFERYNGILGSRPTNNKAVEVQFMSSFLRKQHLHSKSKALDDEFICSLLQDVSCNSTLSIDIELTSILKLSQAPLQPHLYYRPPKVRIVHVMSRIRFITVLGVVTHRRHFGWHVVVQWTPDISRKCLYFSKTRKLLRIHLILKKAIG